MTRLAVCLLVSTAVAAPPEILDGPWPRGFFFRVAESLARNPKIDYADFASQMSRLFGIMGKTLDEEIPGTSSRNIPAFARFKADHPRQAVFLHYNGNARDPLDAGDFWPGHFLFWCGPTITADVPAEAGESVIAVDDVAGFLVAGGRYNDKPDDLLLAPLVAGRVDYARAEQATLVAVEPGTKTLTVRRGRYGSRPVALQAGQAVVQIHVVEGPWGARNNLLWFYNWRRGGPVDPAGRSCADIFVAEFARRLGPGGELAFLDGVEFDVLGWDRRLTRAGRGLDSDGDNRPDGGHAEGVNQYALGVIDLLQRLHEALPDKLWLADGWSDHNQRAVAWLNGIESEGWPSLNDGEILEWSGGLNRHLYNARFARAPRFSYVNHKHTEGGDQAVTPLHCARLVQAACVMMDSGFCNAMRPPGPATPYPIYDELIAGEENRPGWLGRPLGEPVLLAARTPDLAAGQALDGAGDPRATVARDGDRLTLTPAPGQADLAVTLATLTLPPGEIFVRAEVRSGPPVGLPVGVPRQVKVGLRRGGELLTLPRTEGLTIDGTDRPLDPATGAVVRLQPNLTLAGVTRSALFCHPPFRQVIGATWWEVTTTIPPGARVDCATALRSSPGATDGVTYTITAQPADGPPRELVRTHRTGRGWEPLTADLSAFAGQTVRLRFAVDPGPAGNTVADQAYWGRPRLITGAEPPERGPLSPETIMTWAGAEWFEAGFYFREPGGGALELTVEADGPGPLELRGLTVHHAPDLRARVFEGGLVVANPSLHPVTVDLADLSPGVAYRRLRGTPHQEPGLNDGRRCNRLTTVPARDGLFLQRE